MAGALAACDDDPERDQLLEDEYFPLIEEMTGDAAAELESINSQLAGAERYESAAAVFVDLADEMDGLLPPTSVGNAQPRYTIAARSVATAVEGLAAGDAAAGAALEAALSELSLSCEALVAVASVTVPGGTTLDCTLGQSLLD
jgi:hypothetical protein